MLPKKFNKYGLLPPKDYSLSLKALRRSILVEGPANKSENWDSNWRLSLVNNLEILVKQLWKVEIKKIFINGSFVEDKDHPNDIDGYFECDLFDIATGRLQKELNLLDPYKIWTWNRNSMRFDPDSGKKQLPMWHAYRVELYPHYDQSSGIRDKFGYDLTFPSAFRQSRSDHRRKGIVKIKK